GAHPANAGSGPPLSSANDNGSLPSCQLGLGNPDEPRHFGPGSVRVRGNAPGHLFSGPQISGRPDVLLDLISPTVAVLVVPEVQVAPVPDCLHTVATADHHRGTPPLSSRT